jgi:hypothetical protein
VINCLEFFSLTCFLSYFLFLYPSLLPLFGELTVHSVSNYSFPTDSLTHLTLLFIDSQWYIWPNTSLMYDLMTTS